MSILSLKNLYDRMTVEKAGSGAPDNDYKNLEVLKARLDKMYEYRNDTRRDSDTSNDTTPNVVQNICRQHYFSSFQEFQQFMGRDATTSIGDIDDALNYMAYCLCNGRRLAECDCRARQLNNPCQCFDRSPFYCGCYHRTAGKYDGPCNPTVQDHGPLCENRTAAAGCSCHGRCSCDVVNEFEMIRPDEFLPDGKVCMCVDRSYGDSCLCNERTQTKKHLYNKDASACVSKWGVVSKTSCDCKSRTGKGEDLPAGHTRYVYTCDYYVGKA